MSIVSSSETIDLNNNNSSRINSNNITTHETHDLSISINSNNISNTAKISNTGINQEQTGTSSSAKTINGENLEEKKRKLRLPLSLSSSPNTEQNTYQNNNSASSDSINNGSTNSSGGGFLNLNNNHHHNNSNDNEPTHTTSNKRLKAYFDQGVVNFPSFLSSSLSVNETPSLNKDLIKHLDQNNNLPTPQIDKLINELNSNALKTPGSALAILGSNNMYFNSPQIDLSMFDGFTPLVTPGSSINPNVLFSAMNNQTSSATSTAAVSAATVLIAPASLSNNSNNNNNNNINNNNNNNKYTQLTNVQTNNNNNCNTNTGNNFILVQSSDGLNGSSNTVENHDYNILANKTINIKDEKDCPQTVPVYSNSFASRTSNGKAQSAAKSRSKQPATKQTKSASIVNNSDSLNDSSTATPNSSSFNSRRDTGNSTSSSSNLDSSFSPINLDKQETMKLEKKRERNREAARKCRTRKLEKIATLEIQVKNLTETNEMEKAKTDKLREEINTIRLKLEQHKKVHNCDLKLNI